MTRTTAQFADDILAVEDAAAMLDEARRSPSIERAKAAAATGAHCTQILIEAAELLRAWGEPAAALDILQRGTALDGPTAPLQLAYARHCREAGDLDGARQWLRGAMLRARPNAAMALALCEIELRRGDEAAAMEAIELAVRLRWIDAPGLREAADRLKALGRGDLAAAPVMMMYLRARGNASLRSELADLLRAHGPFDRLPAQVRSRLKLDDPATYAEIAPPADEHGYRYTTRWFQTSAKATWDTLIPQIDPARILEIGSFEGASSCYLIDTLSRGKSIELHCVDTWEGGVEHQDGGGAQSDMSGVERRFLDNIRLASDRAAHPVSLHVHKGRSDIMMAKLLAEGFECHFDFVYIDGSHQAPDVLCDAVLGFRLLRDGGVIAFDDYLWHESLPYGVDPIRCPKPAIDAFTNLYCRKLAIMPLSSYQLYARKLSD